MSSLLASEFSIHGRNPEQHGVSGLVGLPSYATRQQALTKPVLQVDVNGPGAHPLFMWLKEASGDPSDIPWNFSKFLVICGKEVKRYSHQVISITVCNS